MRSQIIGAVAFGHSIREISAKFNIPKSTVYDTIKLHPIRKDDRSLPRPTPTKSWDKANRAAATEAQKAQQQASLNRDMSADGINANPVTQPPPTETAHRVLEDGVIQEPITTETGQRVFPNAVIQEPFATETTQRVFESRPIHEPFAVETTQRIFETRPVQEPPFLTEQRVFDNRAIQEPFPPEPSHRVFDNRSIHDSSFVAEAARRVYEQNRPKEHPVATQKH